MKRIIPLMLLVALCLTLIACTEAELPEANEEIQGEEIQEEIEGETPEETPEEPVVPEEPETPDDIPEEPEEVIDYITVKIEKDGVTTEKRFEFPEGFPLSYYVEPELTAPEDFNFGEWGLFVDIDTFKYSAQPNQVNSYAIITDKTHNIDDAMLLYKKFNEKFLLTNPIPEVEEKEDEHGTPRIDFEKEMLPHFTYGEYLCQSHIFSISPEVDRLGRMTLYDKGEKRVTDLEFLWSGWECKYEDIDKHGNVIESAIFPNTGADGYPHDDFDYYEEIEAVKAFGRHTNDYLLGVEYDYRREGDKIFIYAPNSNDTFKDTPEISLYLESNADTSINYDGERLYISIYEFSDTSLEYKKCTYLYDIEKEELEYFGQLYYYTMTISPDRKYVAYTCTNADGLDYPIVREGFYIKEIETGKTTFYSTEDICVFFINILNWVKTDKIEEAINR